MDETKTGSKVARSKAGDKELQDKNKTREKKSERHRMWSKEERGAWTWNERKEEEEVKGWEGQVVSWMGGGMGIVLVIRDEKTVTLQVTYLYVHLLVSNSFQTLDMEVMHDCVKYSIYRRYKKWFYFPTQAVLSFSPVGTGLSCSSLLCIINTWQ